MKWDEERKTFAVEAKDIVYDIIAVLVCLMALALATYLARDGHWFLAALTGLPVAAYVLFNLWAMFAGFMLRRALRERYGDHD